MAGANPFYVGPRQAIERPVTVPQDAHLDYNSHTWRGRYGTEWSCAGAPMTPEAADVTRNLELSRAPREMQHAFTPQRLAELTASGPVPGHLPVDFGHAIRALKAGKRVARGGWNSKGMWLAYSPGVKALPAHKFWAGPNREYAQSQADGCADVLPCITMRTATGEILMGWLASQSDMLAEDWVVLD